MSTVVGVFGRRTARLVPPPPVGSTSHQPIKMVIAAGPNHHHDGQACRLAAISPTVGAQTVDATAASERRGPVPTMCAGPSVSYIGSMVTGEAIAVIARHVSSVVEEACVRAEIIRATRPPCLVFFRTEFIGYVYSDFSFLNQFGIDFGAGVDRALHFGHNHNAF